ncbi:MAG: RelA/SpoT domain-containing protein [Tannerella sp.]|jgi:ppGpp synthetase/RelA/SpoT-type nucleotidyltranferase|nr:RelA/SpoT domain-containing protein [Tannerella sp.]
MSPYIPHNYSNSEIDRAVKELLNKNISQADFQKYVRIFDEWRSSYAYPLLSMRIYMREKALKIEPSSIVSQRLKRKESIFNKIERMNSMRASRMQDIGGCRVVFKNIDSVYKLQDVLKKAKFKHTLQKQTDYIVNPKDSGYRGIHLIYKYGGDKFTGNPVLIEIQIRTHLQHLWATSVEAMGTFTKTPLKSSRGSEEWLRFFQLASSLFAIKEKQPIIRNIPQERDVIVEEIRLLIEQYHLFDQLNAYNVAAKHISKSEGYYYVLVLKYEERTVSVTPFKKAQINEATEMYNNYENSEPDNNVVMVSVDSVDALKKAYPNYFMNTKEFVSTLSELIK